jgi:hypothetical protein
MNYLGARDQHVPDSARVLQRERNNNANRQAYPPGSNFVRLLAAKNNIGSSVNGSSVTMKFVIILIGKTSAL